MIMKLMPISYRSKREQGEIKHGYISTIQSFLRASLSKSVVVTLFESFRQPFAKARVTSYLRSMAEISMRLIRIIRTG